VRYLFSFLISLLLSACSLAPISTLVIQFDRTVGETDLQILKARLLDATGEKANWVALASDRYRLSSYAFPSTDDLNYLFNHQGVFQAKTPDGVALLGNAHIAEMQTRADAQDQPAFYFALSNEGVARLANYSRTHIGSVLRVTLDDEPWSEIKLDTPLDKGHFMLTTQENVQKAMRRAVILRSGLLSAPLKVRAIEQGDAAAKATS